MLKLGLLVCPASSIELSGHGVKHTAVNHVEQVHHDEHLEEERLVEHAVTGRSIGVLHLGLVEVVLDVADLGSEVGEHKHGNDLVKELEKNLTDHGLGDNLVLGRDALLGDLVGIRVLGGESNGGKHIHDKVDPEELNNVEGRVTKEDSGADDVDHAGDVDGDLVLNELANVVLDVASPSDGGDDSHEVVVHKDNIGVVLGGGASVLTHGETNISLAKSAGVTKTLTGDGNASLGFSKSAGEHMLKLWGGSVDDHDRFLEVSLESFHGLRVDKIERPATALILILNFSHERAETVKHILATVAEVSLIEIVGELNVNCSAHDGHLAVSREDSDVGATVTELVNRFDDAFSKRIR